MPLFPKRNPEDAPASGDPASPSANKAALRTQTLTQELLDWLIAALEAVIKTQQFQEPGLKRAKQSLRDALKYADYLYPYTQEVRNREEAPLVLSGTGSDGEPDEASGSV